MSNYKCCQKRLLHTDPQTGIKKCISCHIQYEIIKTHHCPQHPETMYNKNIKYQSLCDQCQYKIIILN